MKQVLLTGASHGLGRNAAAFLAAQGIAYRGVGRSAEALAQLPGQQVAPAAVNLTQLGAQEMAALLAGCDTVWHCAALSSPWGRYQDFYDINYAVTERLAQQAGRQGVARFVHVSTPSVYFDYQHHHQIDEAFCAKKLPNHYAQTKWLAEQAIQRAAAAYPQTRYVILRPRAIFGPYDRVLLPRVWARLRQQKGVLRLPRGGETLMDFTYVANVVQALSLASTQPQLVSGSVFNISNQEPWTLGAVLAALFQHLAEPYGIRAVPYGLVQAVAQASEWRAWATGKDPALTRYGAGTLQFDMTLSPDRAQQQLGYYPEVNMTDAILHTATWLDAHG
ncbi:MAG: NAD-dependent epimerase/dehydratase family protein [Neisseriaceae bacterium]|nr:NAD-dependent epimerase/dehydratase family protein [Neisseriaceae bacterium]